MELRDALTGLLDRGSFDAALKTCVAAATDLLPLGLVFIDVDRFKKVNDEHGHPKGDQVLVEVARRLMNTCTYKGQVYRYGGEEMVALLPNFSLSESVAFAERCRCALEEQSCAGLPITASFGVSVFPALASSLEQLIETADRAMYDAKNRGRNLVRFHGEPPPESKIEKGLPPRKAPVAGGVTERQLAEFRSLHFKHRALECPNDGAYMRTHESHPIGQPTVVIAEWPQCGFHAKF